METLRNKVLETIAYHDLFDFPMTAQEVHRSLGLRARLEEAVLALDALVFEGALGRRAGLHFLAGRETIAALRHDRYDLSERKFRRVRRFFRFARHAPYLRAVFVCNTLGRSNARKESDIDLFLVAEPGRLWTARLFTTGLAALLRLRPTREVTEDRLCLSFFLASDALALRGHAIEGDIYLPHWLHDLFPVHDEAGIAELLQEANSWARAALPGLLPPAPHPRRSFAPVPGAAKRAVERALAPFADRLEAFAKKLQLAWMPDELKKAGAGSGVVLSDSVLKLHRLDRRAEIRDRYRARVAALPKEHAAVLR